MDKKNIFIFWSWWYSKVVIDTILMDNTYNITWIIDFYNSNDNFLWYKLINNKQKLDDIFSLNGDLNIFVAIWENFIREKEINFLKDNYKNIIFPSIIHKKSILSENLKLWEWIFIWPWVIVNTFSSIWDFSLINTKSSIDHDCELWKYSSIWPWVTFWWWIKI